MRLFHRVMVERDILEHPQTQKILQNLSVQDTIPIRKVEDYFNRYKKPYLQKRDHLHLYIGKKEGELIKETPAAYGFDEEKHYFYTHSYNCIYECEYCFLQGYFNTPDLVLFVNHDEICQEIKTMASQQPQGIWFHGGELSDSLALSHLTDELDIYFKCFEDIPHAKLELRTKSANIQSLLKLKALKNVFISFSLSHQEQSKLYDHKTASISARLQAIKRLQDHGYQTAVHFDPLIYHPHLTELFETLLDEMKSQIDIQRLAYASIGVIRFSKHVFKELEKNYPESLLIKHDWVNGFDGKIRYNRPQRRKMIEEIKTKCLQAGFLPERLYSCME